MHFFLGALRAKTFNSFPACGDLWPAQIALSNSSDLDQAQQQVGPDLESELFDDGKKIS